MIISYVIENFVKVNICVFTSIVIAIFSLFLLRKESTRTGRVTVSELFIYPVKSCHGVSVRKAKMTPRGFENDRIFAIVKKTTMEHISLRCTPKMTTIVPEFSADGSSLLLFAPSMNMLTLSLSEPPPGQSELLQIKIWDDCIVVREVSPEASKWVCEALNTSGLMLVRISDSFTRKLGKEFSSTAQTGLADEAPLMMASEKSLDAVNQRLAKLARPAVSLRNFRPNIAVRGCDAFAEDGFKKIIVGGKNSKIAGVRAGTGVRSKAGDRSAARNDDSSNDMILTVAKHTSRCTLPNVNPITGVFDKTLSVTKALREFHTGKHMGLDDISGHKEELSTVYFGVQLDNEGKEGVFIHVGDSLEYTM